MHQALHVPEILLNIFGCCPTESKFGRCSVDLAVLARTCRTFKEPALDVLWEELDDLSPLARCIPEACQLAGVNETPVSLAWACMNPCYSFSRPLNEEEWITLRGYTRRVRFIRDSSINLTEKACRTIFFLRPFDDPLFPRLQSFYWNGTAAFVLPHISVPSLKILRLCFVDTPLPTFNEILNAFGDRCPHMENFIVDHYSIIPEDSTLSGVVCRWPKLQQVACADVALNVNAMLHLSSLSSLESLKFRAGTTLVSQLNQKLIFSSLTILVIRSRLLDTITSLLRYIRLPILETLSVVAEGYIPKQAIQAYWPAVREACPSNIAYLKFCGSLEEDEADDFPDDEELFPCLTLDILRPCTAFAQLRGLEVDFACPVDLTDADLLELVSPRMEYLLINSERGWQIEFYGGISLSGLVQLLHRCPLLDRLSLAIDTETFTKIPEGLDLSFPLQRQLKIDFLDSEILLKQVPALVSTFTALGMDSSMLTAWEFVCDDNIFRPLWKRVFGALKSAS